MHNSLARGFLASAESSPENIALRVEGRELSYAQLRQNATAWAALLDQHAPGGTALTAVFARRSEVACTAMLAALLRGHGYVPLNADFPATRTAKMLTRAGCRAIIVDAEGLSALPAVLEKIDRDLVVWAPGSKVSELAQRWPQHTWLRAEQLATAPTWQPPEVAPSDIAYLLFTSGSTGEPKGVMVAHRNIHHFIDVMVQRYALGPTDRFSQTFELVFDLSVFDHFCAWEVGACLCVPSRADLMAPARYLVTEQITVWFCVPSLGVLMNRLRMLRPGFYPQLRWVLFCGEALPAEVATAFAEASPNATVENLYGPTEVTLACTLYRFDPATSPAECERGLVPIGSAYPGLTARIVDSDLREVPDGEPGELLLCGPQVCPGYWQDPERTARSFTTIPEHPELHYRTGDRVVRSGPLAPIQFLGRVDHQVKVHGHRIELGEIEAAVRQVAQIGAVAIPWPVSAAGADGLVVFVDQPFPDELLSDLAAVLPPYMLPDAVHRIERFPLNANGKIDRHALRAYLEGAP